VPIPFYGTHAPGDFAVIMNTTTLQQLECVATVGLYLVICRQLRYHFQTVGLQQSCHEVCNEAWTIVHKQGRFLDREKTAINRN